ncbi:hypothetical protein N2152v2_003980 [Parachlorella kessleri]
MARPVKASSSGFAELKTAAESDYSKVKGLLPTLETALQTAAQARGPAEDAEAAWQFCHRKLSDLADKVHGCLAELREAMVGSAGGEEHATVGLVRHHLRARMARVLAQLEPDDWEEFEPTAVSLPVGGAQFLAQVAACQVGERCYALVCMAVGGPFLSNDLRSLLLHWAAARKAGARWEQPPKGWLSQPTISHAQGDRAWQTQFGLFAPQILGMPVEEAAVHSVVLQLPLEVFLFWGAGVLEETGAGLPFVLKRTDGGHPEWVKKQHHHDFFLDLSQAIDFFAKRREEEGEEEEAAVAAAVTAGAAAAAATAAPPRQEWFSSWGLDEWDWGRGSSSSADARRRRGSSSPEREAQDGSPTLGWLSQVSSWEEVHDQSRPSPPPAASLQRLRQVAKALAAHGPAGALAGPGAAAESSSKSHADGRALMRQCDELLAFLKELDAAQLATAAAQRRKEQLHEVFVKAEATVAQLRGEVVGSLETARRAAVRLRGRNTEITQADLQFLAAQLAEELSNAAEAEEEEAARRAGGQTEAAPRLGRQLAFLSESSMRLAGTEAQVLVQTYLDGPKQPAPPSEPEAPAPAGEAQAATLANGVGRARAGGTSPSRSRRGSRSPSHSVSNGVVDAAALVGSTPSVLEGIAGGANAAAKPSAPPPPPAYDSVLVSVVMGEDFPGTSSAIKAPLLLHWAACRNEGGAWLAAPEGWAASARGSRKEGAATQTPLQRYTVTLESGDPVLVDPCLYAVCLRLPLHSVQASGAQGLEFVLRGQGGTWMLRQQPQGRTSNFFMALPRVA